MLRAVLDSSVLVSAFLKPTGTVATALHAASEGRFQLYLSEAILGEVKRVLMRPRLRRSRGYAELDVDAFLDEICVIAEIAADLPAIPRTSRDPDDDHVIAAALATGAECIVTGDDDLLVLGQHEGIVILSVRAFLERLGGTYP